MDYPVVEMVLEETIRCLRSLPPALRQNDFTPVLQAIEAVSSNLRFKWQFWLIIAYSCASGPPSTEELPLKAAKRKEASCAERYQSQACHRTAGKVLKRIGLLGRWLILSILLQRRGSVH